jgi:lysophospholipase L1-like esterase
MQRHYTYLALGDSYTIGEAVLLQESFPYQTVQFMRKAGFDFCAPEIIARTGWTTEELQAAMAGFQFSEKYDFVSLLIGVNNQYRQQEIILYKEHFESLLRRGLDLAGGKKDHFAVLSIPDYSVTPFAGNSDKEKISKEIEEYNKLAMAVCLQYKIAFLDMTEASREAVSNPALLAGDALHPSAKAYRQWAKQVSDLFSKTLKK